MIIKVGDMVEVLVPHEGDTLQSHGKYFVQSIDPTGNLFGLKGLWAHGSAGYDSVTVYKEYVRRVDYPDMSKPMFEQPKHRGSFDFDLYGRDLITTRED